MFGRFLRLIEELTKQIFSSGFSAVRSRAMETAPRSLGVQLCFHRGAILTVLCFKQVCIEASTITSCRYIYIYIHIQSHTRIYIYIHIQMIYAHTHHVCIWYVHTGYACIHVCTAKVAMAVQYHQGCRWPLIRDVLLPALSKETNAVLRCGTLTGSDIFEG